MRVQQARLATEANALMGEPEEMVSAVEHEVRVYVHDILEPNHEKDFRSFAVFPIDCLQDVKLVVIRGDYKGGLIAEAVVGSAWQPGSPMYCTFIHKGHMTYLQPPEGFDIDAFMVAEDAVQTPSLGFTFYYHSSHDQPATAPGRIHCRLCRTTRKEGEFEVSGCRRHSCLASMATCAGSQAAVQVRRAVRAPGDQPTQHELVLQEVFAGVGRITEEWRRTGHAQEPIEVFNQPHLKQGYRPEHDLLRPEVQTKVRQEAITGPANVWWIAAPCTTYCDWQLQNGGSRTFAALGSKGG